MKKKTMRLAVGLVCLALLAAGCSQGGSQGAGNSAQPAQSAQAGAASSAVSSAAQDFTPTGADPDSLSNEAANWMIEGDYHKALACYTRALELDDSRADLYAFRADAYIALEDLESARNDFYKSAELYTQQGEADLAQYVTQRAEDPLAEVGYDLEEPEEPEQPQETGDERKPDLYYANNGVLKIHYVYDDAGVLREEIEYYQSGEEYLHTYFEYDEKGNLSRKSIYLWNGTLLSVYEYEYDGQGRLTARNHFDGEGVPQDRWEYGPDGKVKEEIEYNPDGSVYYVLEHRSDGTVWQRAGD